MNRERGPILFAASSGGHLAQLRHMAPRLAGGEEDTVWVTFDGPQARGDMTELNVKFMREIRPRDWLGVLRGFRVGLRVLRTERPVRAYSTGSAIALTILPFARLFGCRAVYIESAARCHGPSLTGRLLSWLPWVETYSQYHSWCGGRWKHIDSVFADFQLLQEPEPIAPGDLRLVVLLGTLDYRFDRLIDAVSAALPPGSSVVWQLGGSYGVEVTGRAVKFLDSDVLREELAHATGVVAHAGCGSALDALSQGLMPILVSRERSRGEHVDDHQALIGQELVSRSVGLHVSPREIDQELLLKDYRVVGARASCS